MENYEEHLDRLVSNVEPFCSRNNVDRIILCSGDKAHYYGDDIELPFVTNPYFRYFFPFIKAPEIYLIVVPQKRITLVFPKSSNIWEKEDNINPKFLEKFNVIHEDNFEEKLKSSNTKHVLFLGSLKFEELNNNEKCLNKLKKFLNYQRLFKSGFEFLNISKANEIALQGHQEAKKLFLEGKSEFEIHLSYLQVTEQLEYETPYTNIIGINKNASVLHYRQKERLKKNNLSLLIDAGATCNGYNSDITRTYTSESNHIFQELIIEMEAVQQAIIAEIVQGKLFTKLHESAIYSIAEILRNFDIVRLEPEKIIREKIVYTFFPHGLGHSLGLQVHDVGGKQIDEQGNQIDAEESYRYLRMTRKLEEGMVFTIEPGIYFISSLLNKLKSSHFAKYVNWKIVNQLEQFGGIRVEDNIAIKNGQIINLTRNYEDGKTIL